MADIKKNLLPLLAGTILSFPVLANTNAEEVIKILDDGRVTITTQHLVQPILESEIVTEEFKAERSKALEELKGLNLGDSAKTLEESVSKSWIKPELDKALSQARELSKKNDEAKRQAEEEAKRKAEEEARKKAEEERKAREAREAQAQEASAGNSASSASTPSGNSQYPSTVAGAEAAFAQIVAELGLSQSEIDNWRELIRRESTWNPLAQNAYSGAYGLGQALPAGKMAVYGSDYLTNPYTQLKFMKGYVSDRYGSFGQAIAFHNANGWY